MTQVTKVVQQKVTSGSRLGCRVSHLIAQSCSLLIVSLVTTGVDFGEVTLLGAVQGSGFFLLGRVEGLGAA